MSRRVGMATLLCLIPCRRRAPRRHDALPRRPQIHVFAANRSGHHAGELIGGAGEGRHAQYRQLMIG